jgi:hypothetical protein
MASFDAVTMPASALPAGPRQRLRVLVLDALAQVWGSRRSRRQPLDLDVDGLSEVSMTRKETLGEARRVVWDAPDHWLRRTSM